MPSPDNPGWRLPPANKVSAYPSTLTKCLCTIKDAMRSGSTDFYQVVTYIDSIIFIIYGLLPIKQFFQHNLHGSISDNFQTIQTCQFLFQQLGFTAKFSGNTKATLPSNTTLSPSMATAFFTDGRMSDCTKVGAPPKRRLDS